MNNSLKVLVVPTIIRNDRKERTQKEQGEEKDWMETIYNELQSVV